MIEKDLENIWRTAKKYKHTCIAYTNDIELISRRKEELVDLMNNITEAAKRIEFTVMGISKTNGTTLTLVLE